MRLRTDFAALSKLLARWQYFCWEDRGHLPTARKRRRQHGMSQQQQQQQYNSSLWRAATFDFRWEWCVCDKCGGAFAGFLYLCCCSAYRCVSSSSSRAVKKTLKTLTDGGNGSHLLSNRYIFHFQANREVICSWGPSVNGTYSRFSSLVPPPPPVSACCLIFPWSLAPNFGTSRVLLPCVQSAKNTEERGPVHI